MRSTRSDLKDSRFPLKLGLQPAPLWKRRLVSSDLVTRHDLLSGSREPAPGTTGDRVRRSEHVEAEAAKLNDIAQSSSDNDS